MERWWQDTENRVRTVNRLQRAAGEMCVAAESSHPGVVGENHDLSTDIVRMERPAQEHSYAERFEEVCSDAHASEHVALAVLKRPDTPVLPERQPINGRRLSFHVEGRGGTDCL